MSQKIKIEIETNVSEGVKILQAIVQSQQIKKELKFPYECWNCGNKIQKQEDLDKGTCPVCGLSVPEP